MRLPAVDLIAGEALLDSTPTRLAHGGERPPRRPGGREDNGVVGTALFVGTEAMLFAGLISAFLILRAGSSLWPPAGQPRLPVTITGINTLLLLLSAVTMQRACSDSVAGRRPQMIRWLSATALLGSVFLAVQGFEWVRLLRFGLRASSSLYGSTFYTLVGCHGVHVLAAVIVLLAVLGRTLREPANVQARSAVEACRIYWFFVVGVWPLIYALVYLA